MAKVLCNYFRDKFEQRKVGKKKMYASTSFEQYYRELSAAIGTEYGMQKIYCSKDEPFIRVANCLNVIMGEIDSFHKEKGTENGKKEKTPIDPTYIKAANEYLKPHENALHLHYSGTDRKSVV